MKKYGKVTKKSTQIVMLDIVLAFAVGSFFAYRALPDTVHATTILAASFASVLPDVIEGPYFFLGLKSKFLSKWLAFQKAIQNDTTVAWGLLTQGLTIITAFLWILR
jgi:hypothetical protein